MLVVVGLATPMVMDSEGLRTKAYIDPVGIPTICFGETLGVKMGDVATVPECTEQLQKRLVGFLAEMRACTTVELPPMTEAAMLGFTYNLGSGVYCESMARKRINVGRIRAACDALLLYNKGTIKGKKTVLPGLVRRRQEERAMCLEGLK